MRTGPPAVQRGLRASDNSHRLGRSLSTDCRSKGVPSDHCWIVFTVTSNSEVTAGEVSLRYELEPTGGPDAGPGLPGWVTPQETSISAPSDRTVDIARASLVEHLLDCLDSGTIPVTSADRARHVLEIMPGPTHVRTRGPCRRADDHICAMTLRIRHSARRPADPGKIESGPGGRPQLDESRDGLTG
jgi:hypothetical protein